VGGYVDDEISIIFTIKQALQVYLLYG